VPIGRSGQLRVQLSNGNSKAGSARKASLSELNLAGVAARTCAAALLMNSRQNVSNLEKTRRECRLSVTQNCLNDVIAPLRARQNRKNG
jgi:hypothetical protein